MKVVGVTGGSGFIASHTIKELLSRGYKVVAFDRHNHDNLPEGVDLFLGDMRDDVAMTEFAAHVDGIIHLAGVLGTQETIDNPRPATESNVMGGLNFLEAVAQYDIPGVYICVGNRGMYSTYSLSKSLVEDFVHMFNNYRGTRVNQVRAVNAYGEGQSVAAPFGSSKVRKITPSFICRALTDMDIELYGGGTQISDMVYVGDVAKALVNALEAADEGEVVDVVEVGPKEPKTVREVAELIKQLTMSNSDITSLPMRKGETPNAIVTANYKTLQLIGMHVDDLVSIEDGMMKTIEWYQDNEGKAWTRP